MRRSHLAFKALTQHHGPMCPLRDLGRVLCPVGPLCARLQEDHVELDVVQGCGHANNLTLWNRSLVHENIPIPENADHSISRNKFVLIASFSCFIKK